MQGVVHLLCRHGEKSNEQTRRRRDTVTIEDRMTDQGMFLPTLPSWQRMLWSTKLLLATAVFGGGFVWLLYWFARVDVYHEHFFDHGKILLRYSLCRVLFIGWLAWLIYFPGAAVLAGGGGRRFMRTPPAGGR